MFEHLIKVLDAAEERGWPEDMLSTVLGDWPMPTQRPFWVGMPIFYALSGGFLNEGYILNIRGTKAGIGRAYCGGSPICSFDIETMLLEGNQGKAYYYEADYRKDALEA